MVSFPRYFTVCITYQPPLVLYNCRIVSEQWDGKDAQGSGLKTGSSIENRIQTHGKFHGLIFPPITYKVVQIWPGLFTLVYTQISPGHIWITLYVPRIYHLPHVRVSVGNYILNLSGIHDFEGTETPGNRSLIKVLHFSYASSLTYVPTMKILRIKPYFIPTHKIIVGCTVSHTSATFRRINWTFDLRRQMIQCNCQRNDNTGGVSVI